MTFKSRLTTAIATGAVLVSALAPIASADTTINVTGNGALSNNAVSTSSNTTSVVNQTNNADISNNVNSNASTGGNSSNFNTGGQSTIRTGNATDNVSINNAANLNSVTVSNCGCSSDPINVSVGGNGAYSSNGVSTNNTSSTFLNQNNDANYNNNVTANATSGKNDSSFDTGGGSVIVTGNASTNVSVNNAANANVANVGGNDGSSDPSNIDVSGNGAFSTTGVALEQDSAVVLNQANDASIRNNVDANAKTGQNQQQFNTGGFVGIATGNATDNVGVSNAANFNVANLDCGCALMGTDISVGGNGAESDNGVSSSSNNSVFPNQTNNEALLNGVKGGSGTGSNDLGYSTGSVLNDPVVVTGDGTSTTDVNNVGNGNVYDNGTSVSLPGGWTLGTTFNLNGFFSSLQGLI
jgi:hypothetical protein